MHIFRCPRLPLVVSGVIFALFALLHLARLSFGWMIIIGSFNFPMWASGIAVIVGTVLAVWMVTFSCYCVKCDVCDVKKE